MARYRKKPVVIEAVQWVPEDLEQAGHVVGWLMGAGIDFRHPSGEGPTTTLAIDTLEGRLSPATGSFEAYRASSTPASRTSSPRRTRR